MVNINSWNNKYTSHTKLQETQEQYAYGSQTYKWKYNNRHIYNGTMEYQPNLFWHYLSESSQSHSVNLSRRRKLNREFKIKSKALEVL